MRTAWSIGWKVLLAIWACGAIVLLLSFRSFSMSSASMIPTLWQGDYLAVSTTAYGISKYSVPGRPDLFEGRLFARPPQRGDVIVFAFPRDPSQSWIKRVIGLPGETIQMKEGRLYINGTVVPRTTAAKVETEDNLGQKRQVPTFEETLPGGVAHKIIEMQGDKGFLDSTDVFRVPANSYFVMGDNRDNSMDSRVAPDQGGVGYVPFDHLIGRVDFVFLASKTEDADASARRVR